MRRQNTLLAIGVIVTVLVSCTTEKDPEPNLCTVLPEVIVDSIVEATGCNTNDGNVTVTVSGEGEYTYSIDSINFQSSPTITGLSVGNYTVVARDANGCDGTVSVTINSSLGNAVVNEIVSTESGCGSSDGSITITATGTGTIQYKLNDGAFQSNNFFNNLEAGAYTVALVDDSGCEVTSDHSVLSGVSFQDQVSSIISSNCAISGCHNGSNGTSRNFTIFNNVQSKADGIKARTQSGSMPPPASGSLTQEQIRLIACWVDDGALNN